MEKVFELSEENQALRNELEWYQDLGKISLFVGLSLGAVCGVLISIVWRVIFG